MHKPQWNARKGTENEGYKRWVKSSFVSMRDLPTQTTLKRRQIGQHSRDGLRQRDYRKELQERETQHYGGELRGTSTAISAIEHATAADNDVSESKRAVVSEGEAEEENEEVVMEGNKRAKYDDEDDELAESDGEGVGAEEEEEDDDVDSDSDSDSDEDEDAELARELARIKQERQRQEMLKEQQQRTQDQLSGNPLLMEESFEDDDLSSVTASSMISSSATVKRKWNEDTIFRNQARDEVQPKKRFINDTLRSDFHKKFLQKYIK